MAVRKELLERELNKMGLRKADARRGVVASVASAGQQEGQGTHPQAGQDNGQHGD
jgi:hypothetical protein